jgi:hypothetical protein
MSISVRISTQVDGFGWQLPHQTTQSDPASQIAIQRLIQSERPIKTSIHSHPVRDIQRMPIKNGQSTIMVDDTSIKKFAIICWFWVFLMFTGFPSCWDVSTHTALDSILFPNFLAQRNKSVDSWVLREQHSISAIISISSLKRLKWITMIGSAILPFACVRDDLDSLSTKWAISNTLMACFECCSIGYQHTCDLFDGESPNKYRFKVLTFSSYEKLAGNHDGNCSSAKFGFKSAVLLARWLVWGECAVGMGMGMGMRWGSRGRFRSRREEMILIAWRGLSVQMDQ